MFHRLEFFKRLQKKQPNEFVVWSGVKRSVDMVWGEMLGTIRQKMILLLEEERLDVRDLSQVLGLSEKDVYAHLEHIQRSVSRQGKNLFMAPCECLSCGYVFKDRKRIKKPGRCPKCRQSHILGAMFKIE